MNNYLETYKASVTPTQHRKSVSPSKKGIQAKPKMEGGMSEHIRSYGV